MAVEPSAPPETPTDPAEPPVSSHQRALDFFTLCDEAFRDQRERELDDLRFVDEPGAQWPDDIRRAREGRLAGGGIPAIGARPCLEFHLLRGPLQQVCNTARSAKLGLSFAPEGDRTSREVAQAFDDIARAIQADSRAHLARQWAFDRVAKCGFGAYRILTEYANNQYGDQKIVYKRILNQASVYLDPFAQEPDWCDGQRALITQDLPAAQFRKRYPSAKLAQYTDRELTSVGNDVPGWVTANTDKPGASVRIAESWEVREETTVYVQLPDGAGFVPEATIPPEILAAADQIQRLPRHTVITARRVFWSLIDGIEELMPPQEWNGSYIPIIPVVGDETNLNGDRRWSGIVQFSRDAQQSYNYMRSAQVESVGLAPRAPWLIADGQLEGYEKWWQEANTRNLPYLPYRATTFDGKQAPIPQRNIAEPAIQAITLAAAQAKDDLHATTNLPPVSLGQLDPHERSGKAIQALQAQAEIGSSGYLDNLATISMLYEGKVLKDLIPRIYDRPGRVVPAMDASEKRRSLMVNIPFVEQNGQPQPVPPGTEGAQVLDLKAAELSVTAVVGKSYQTRRQETADALTVIMGAAPGLAPILAPYWLDELDFPGAKKLAAIAKKALPPQFQEQEGEQPSVAQLQQQVAQAEQMIELLTKELQAKTEAISIDQVKTDGQIQMTQLEIASKERIEVMKVEADLFKVKADLAKAELSAVSAVNQARMGVDAGLERQRLAGDQQLARQQVAGSQQLDRQQMAGVQASTQQVAQHAHESEQAARQQQAEREAQQATFVQQQQMAAQEGPGPGGPAGGPGGPARGPQGGMP